MILAANGRIPALVDHTSGKPKRVFEGASMQLYLCEKYDKDHKISFPYDSDEYWETVEWLVWMVGLARNIHFSSQTNIQLPPMSTNMEPPTNSILLKRSKAASDQCKGKPTTFLAVSIAVIHESLKSFGFG
jgi:glutathione S-transferase